LGLKFEVIHKGEVLETKDFAEGNYKIGRASVCDIQLRSAQVSKQHALLVIKGNKAAVVDVGSSNGVFVNGILVRKQRIEPGDEIVIADYTLKIATGKRVRERRPGSVDDGNLAHDLNYAEPAPEAPPEMTPQEKLLILMDQKILTPYYGILKTVDWRMVLFALIGGAMALTVLVSVFLIVDSGKNITRAQALLRAHTILSQAVRENYRIITKTNDFTKLTTEAAESETGILSCVIIDPKTNAILAPVKYLNKTMSDIYTLLAIKHITEDKEETVSIEKTDNVYVVAQPIYVFSQEANDRTLQVVVVAEFEVPSNVSWSFNPMAEALLVSALIGLLGFYLIMKMFSYPVATMQEQLDAALKGESVTVTSEARFGELESLATQINFALSRLKQGGGVGAQTVNSGDPEVEDASYVKAVQEFDQGSTDGILLLDRDKKIRYVGKVLEDLIGLRSQYALGQNISDACRDQSFAGTSIDLADNVIQSLGETQVAQLDINGTARSMTAVAHKNVTGEIHFILITVKLNVA
jgi:pSer/pThr/pTyr-binding forkhead associated (FHA) protein